MNFEPYLYYRFIMSEKTRLMKFCKEKARYVNREGCYRVKVVVTVFFPSLSVALCSYLYIPPVIESSML